MDKLPIVSSSIASQGASTVLSSVKPSALRLFERIYSSFSFLGSLKNRKIMAGFILLVTVVAIWKRLSGKNENPQKQLQDLADQHTYILHSLGLYAAHKVNSVKTEHTKYLLEKGLDKNLYQPIPENVIEELGLDLDETYKNNGEDFNPSSWGGLQKHYPDITLREVAKNVIQELNNVLSKKEAVTYLKEKDECQDNVISRPQGTHIRFATFCTRVPEDIKGPDDMGLHNSKKGWIDSVLEKLQEKGYICMYVNVKDRVFDVLF